VALPHHSMRGSRRWLMIAATCAAGVALGIGAAWGFAAVTADGGGTDTTAVADAVPSAIPSDSAGTSAVAGATSTIPPLDAPSGSPSAPTGVGPSSVFDDAQFSLDDPDSPWVVVNKQRPLTPLDYAPDDVVGVSGVTVEDGGGLRREASDALTTMHEAAAADGIAFRVSSGYRDYARQADLYAGYEAESGTAHADTFSARPGYTEHQTGWAADLFDHDDCRLKACFGESEAGRWVADNAADFGFIIRYPEGKEAVTGFKYEPWHVRYVGVDLASQMREDGTVTLEEFFGLPDAPGY
jgi:D-alanyl-D-alanine carboxypeptidase